jgi:hypothetical protein
VTDEPAAAIDLAPTVMKHFGFPTEDWLGIPLQHTEGRANRPIEFFVTTRGPKYVRRYIFKDGTWIPTVDLKTRD